MASTRRSTPVDPPAAVARASANPADPLPDAVATALALALPVGGRCAIALSGGRDSMALLDAAATGAPPDTTLVALHVHHGLSRHADGWALHCTAAGAARGVTVAVRRVAVPRAPRQSLEEAARRVRYTALTAMAQSAGASVVLLGHHQDDQAETLLLQLLRGAGPRGLAAMPRAYVAGGVTWVRPLLDLPRACIDAFVARRGLAYVDDDSNGDSAHRRNGLRVYVLPALRALAPGYPATLARAAAHQAEAAALLHELARADARTGFDGVSLGRATLAALPPPRARNVLRWFLHERGLPAPSTARLEAMLAQLCTARCDAAVRLQHAGRELGVFRGRVVVHAGAAAPFAQRWGGQDPLALPHGTLCCAQDGTGELDAQCLFSAPVTVRSRRGGERMRVAHDRPARALSDLMREAAVPPWERGGWPLVFAGDALVAVPGIAMDPGVRAGAPARGATLVWRPDEAFPPAPPIADPAPIS